MFIAFYFIFCLAVAFLGRHRKIGWLGFFIVSLLLTPVITLLILVLTADKRTEIEQSADA
jgi:hypothetical protein